MDEKAAKAARLAEETPFLKLIGVKVDDNSVEGCVMHIDLRDDLKNPYGLAHGGIYFSISDACAATAARADGRHYVTLSVNINYLKSTTKGRIIARSHMIKKGRTTAVYSVDTYDENGTQLSYAVVTLFCIGE